MKFDVRILDPGDIARIEAQALRVLERAGVTVDHERLRALAGRAGCPIDDLRVCFPEGVVREALRLASRNVVLHGASGQELPLKPGHCHLSTYSEAVNVSDYGAAKLRPSTRQDVVNFVRLGQSMPEISLVGPVCFARDLPEPVQLLRSAEIVVLNSDKHHTVAPLSALEAQAWYDLAQLVSPGVDLAQTPTISFVVSPTSPLQLDQETSLVLEFSAAHNIPFIAASCPMAGGTSPAALVGTIVQHLAEDLAILTLAQLVRAGAPVIMGGAAGLLDLRTGSLSYGAPERHLLLGAVIELAEHYGLPHHSPAGSVDAWHPDVHAGAEKMQCWMARKAHRIVYGVAFGSLFNGSAVSLEQMLIDADLWREAGRYFGGLDLSEVESAAEIIERVGPGGNFLTEEQTMRLMRSDEFHYSRVSNRQGDRAPSMLERAHQEVERRLAEATYSVPDPVASQIQHYVDEQAARLMEAS
jgi:trimethylamine--corrinoid protein Co-methyltransferase